VVGCLVLLVSATFAASGGAVQPAGLTAGAMLSSAAVVLLSLGAVILGLAGSRPFDGIFVRLGLGLLGLGMAAVVAPTGASASSMLVVVYLLGGLVAAIGAILTEMALLRSSGRARQIAIGFLVGLLIALAAAGLVNVAAADLGGVAELAKIASPILGAIGGGVMLAAVAAIGALGLRAPAEIGSRS